jgi:hypothetical protein
MSDLDYATFAGVSIHSVLSVFSSSVFAIIHSFDELLKAQLSEQPDFSFTGLSNILDIPHLQACPTFWIYLIYRPVQHSGYTSFTGLSDILDIPLACSARAITFYLVTVMLLCEGHKLRIF